MASSVWRMRLSCRDSSHGECRIVYVVHHQSVQLPLDEHSSHLPLLGSSCMIGIQSCRHLHVACQKSYHQHLPINHHSQLLLRLCCLSAFLQMLAVFKTLIDLLVSKLRSTGQCLQTRFLYVCVCVCVCVKKNWPSSNNFPKQ